MSIIQYTDLPHQTQLETTLPSSQLLELNELESEKSSCKALVPFKYFDYVAPVQSAQSSASSKVQIEKKGSRGQFTLSTLKVNQIYNQHCLDCYSCTLSGENLFTSAAIYVPHNKYKNKDFMLQKILDMPVTYFHTLREGQDHLFDPIIHYHEFMKSVEALEQEIKIILEHPTEILEHPMEIL